MPHEPTQMRVPPELDGRRMDEVLAALVPELSRARLQKLVRRGALKHNGRRVSRSNLRVRAGDRLHLAAQTAQASSKQAQPEREKLRWIFMDEHLAAVDKPAGLPMHAADGLQGPTLAELAAGELGVLPQDRGPERAGIAHRLDRGTSGLCLIARSAVCLAGLRDAFRQRRVHKRYLAFGHGLPTRKEFEIEAPIAPEREGADRQRVQAGGRPALTHATVLERYESWSLFECRPTTGRRHQLRVHLSHAGHPLLGDRMYRRDGLTRLPMGAPRLRRPALHAAGLALQHPVSGEQLKLEAPLARDLVELQSWLLDHARAGPPSQG